MKLFILANLLVFVAADKYWPWDPRTRNNPDHSSSWPGSNSLHNSGSSYSSVFYPTGTSAFTSAQADVNEIKTLLINVELKMQNFCRKHTDRPLKEAYGVTHYRLYANMTGCSEEGLEVRAGQRLVAVQAKDSRCNYIALRLLPDVVDSNSAFWRFQNEELNILFPYSSDRHRCGRVLSEDVHRLPKFEADTEYPDIDVRLGDEALGQALRSYSANHFVRRESAEQED